MGGGVWAAALMVGCRQVPTWQVAEGKLALHDSSGCA